MPSATVSKLLGGKSGCYGATIAIRHLNEEKFRYSPEWPRRAGEYLRLAERHIAACQ